MPSDKHAEFVEALGKTKLDGTSDMFEKFMFRFTKKAPRAEDMPPEMSLFNAETVEQILIGLDEVQTEWATKQAKTIRSKSPLASVVTLEALRRGMAMTFREAMSMELDVSLNFLATQDFYEGIRAQLIDKDRKPGWSHDGVEKVTDAQLKRLFKNTAKPPLKFLGA